MSPSSAAERVASRIHTFGTVAFDSGSLELTRDGRRVALEPQPARALARLLRGAGELVTREQMRAAIASGF